MLLVIKMIEEPLMSFSKHGVDFFSDFKTEQRRLIKMEIRKCNENDNYKTSWNETIKV